MALDNLVEQWHAWELVKDSKTPDRSTAYQGLTKMRLTQQQQRAHTHGGYATPVQVAKDSCWRTRNSLYLEKACDACHTVTFTRGHVSICVKQEAGVAGNCWRVRLAHLAWRHRRGEAVRPESMTCIWLLVPAMAVVFVQPLKQKCCKLPDTGAKQAALKWRCLGVSRTPAQSQ